MSGPFPVRGVIEGFYGPPYTHPQRLDLIRFLGSQGYGLYVYAPKNDRKHRSRWREPYAPRAMERFTETIAAAREAGIEFCFALSPGTDMRYSSDDDVDRVISKLAWFAALGGRSFSLLLDDISSRFRHEADARRFGSYAEAHADLCNRTLTALRASDPDAELGMCPTRYHGTAPFDPYLSELGRRLDPAIDVFYTGPDVCSRTITGADARAFGEEVGRPPLIWDNYPVNDLAMQGELHLGPIRGRGPDLHEAARGIVVNPMLQPEASKIPLATFAEYLDDPDGYDPAAAWERALVLVAGEESAPFLRLLAETSLHSCLGTPEAPALDALADAAVSSLRNGADPAADEHVRALRHHLIALDEACDHLKVEMPNLALRNELLPWIDALETWVWMGRHALEALEAQHSGRTQDAPMGRVRELHQWALAHHKRIGGRCLEPLAASALRGEPRRSPS